LVFDPFGDTFAPIRYGDHCSRSKRDRVTIDREKIATGVSGQHSTAHQLQQRLQRINPITATFTKLPELMNHRKTRYRQLWCNVLFCIIRRHSTRVLLGRLSSVQTRRPSSSTMCHSGKSTPGVLLWQTGRSCCPRHRNGAHDSRP